MLVQGDQFIFLGSFHHGHKSNIAFWIPQSHLLYPLTRLIPLQRTTNNRQRRVGAVAANNLRAFFSIRAIFSFQNMQVPSGAKYGQIANLGQSRQHTLFG